ncbi:MAG: hypothetical protein KIT62_04400 [Cyclobacteriaceae bacterium]|nr:hypothetical protein [Cyclobacteriaceae bacterium]
MVRYALVMLGVLGVLMGTTRFGSVQAWWSLPPLWVQVLIFLFLIHLIIGFNLVRIRKKQPQMFTQFYLLSIALKMVAGLAFIFFLVWDNPAEAGPTAALFMVAYVLFTLAEVVYLLRASPDRHNL